MKSLVSSIQLWLLHKAFQWSHKFMKLGVFLFYLFFLLEIYKLERFHLLFHLWVEIRSYERLDMSITPCFALTLFMDSSEQNPLPNFKSFQLFTKRKQFIPKPTIKQYRSSISKIYLKSHFKIIS